MNLSSFTPTQLAGGQIALAAVLAAVGFALLLPQPRGRSVMGGVAAVVAALVVFGAWLHTTFGQPMPDTIEAVLFGLFSLGALGFGTALVVQKNPARGAIAFAFVILSTCGLFLLLAAPFLMAVTIIVYAGAIIVTFLFVLMLSQVDAPSAENDRSREPWFGGLAGFAFAGLVLFTLYLSTPAKAAPDTAVPKAASRLPAAVLTIEERKALTDALAKLDGADAQLDGDLKADRASRLEYFAGIKTIIAGVVGVSRDEEAETIKAGSLRVRLEKSEGTVLYREDEQARAVLRRAATIRELNWLTYKRLEESFLGPEPKADLMKAEIRKLREEVLLLAGAGELPARNVANLGYLLYTDHLLAVELAGTLLLVATIGAIAITRRKGAVA